MIQDFSKWFSPIKQMNVKHADLYINRHDACYNDYGLKQSAIWPTNTLCITIAANIAETGILPTQCVSQIALWFQC